MTNNRTITTSHKNTLETINVMYDLKGYQIAADEPDIDECQRLDELTNDILGGYVDRYDSCEMNLSRESCLAIWSRLYDLREIYSKALYVTKVKRVEQLMTLFE